MTAKQLIKLHNDNHPESYAFSKNTLAFFGEKISEMRVWKGLHNITDFSGNEHFCYVLATKQHNFPITDRVCIAYHYIDSETFEIVDSETRTFLKEIPFC